MTPQRAEHLAEKFCTILSQYYYNTTGHSGINAHARYEMKHFMREVLQEVAQEQNLLIGSNS